MAIKETKHPFETITDLINDYNDNKNSYDRQQLQDLRDNISLNFFYLSDSVSAGISNYDAACHIRKIKNAKQTLLHRKEGNTVADAEHLARIDCEQEADKEVEALRVKERVRIIINAVPHILNSISTRINSIDK